MKPPEMLKEALESIISSKSDEFIVSKAKSMLNDLKGGNKVCKLNKANGLRQSGRLWHTKIDNILKDIGLRPTVTNPCLYKDTKDRNTYLLLYVDDIIVVSKNHARVTEIKRKL